MSKSLDNYIGIDEPAESMYEKAMKIPDDCMMQYFDLTTDIPTDEAEKLIKEDIRNAHRRYAEEIIRMYHGEEFIKPAEERYNNVAKGMAPDQIKEFSIGNDEISICDALVKVGFAMSKATSKIMQEIERIFAKHSLLIEKITTSPVDESNMKKVIYVCKYKTTFVFNQVLSEISSLEDVIKIEMFSNYDLK